MSNCAVYESLQLAGIQGILSCCLSEQSNSLLEQTQWRRLMDQFEDRTLLKTLDEMESQESGDVAAGQIIGSGKVAASFSRSLTK